MRVRKTAPFFSQFPQRRTIQATAVWTWSNFLHEQVPLGQTPLHVNFDETGIRYFQDSRQGHLTEAALRKRRTPRSLTKQVRKGDTRAMMSLATFVCDDEALQPILPQVLLVNTKLLTNAEAEACLHVLPPGVHLWRLEKAWTTGDVMVKLLRTLEESLTPVLHDRKVILSADAFRAHLTKPVFRAAATLGFFYFVIPARMTWALQPLDTHIFAIFKRSLAEKAQAASAASQDGKLSRTILIDCIGQTVMSVLRGRSWKRAFEDCGLTGTQATVSARTCAKLGTASPPPGQRTLPSLEMLQEIFPDKAWIPVDDVFRAFIPLTATTRKTRRGTPEPATSSLAAPDPRAPWQGRLRSSSALHMEAVQKVPITDSACRPPSPAPPPVPPMQEAQSMPPPPGRPRVPRARPLGPPLRCWTPPSMTSSSAAQPPVTTTSSASGSTSSSSKGT